MKKLTLLLLAMLILGVANAEKNNYLDYLISDLKADYYIEVKEYDLALVEIEKILLSGIKLKKRELRKYENYLLLIISNINNEKTLELAYIIYENRDCHIK